MSTTEVSKVLAPNESNIPVPKKMLAGAKKSKGCAQLPELQKYIETIIKASNECESDNISLSERDKFPKERQFSRDSLNKGSGSKVKLESFKFDSRISRSKSSTKAKAPSSEAVSSGGKQFFSSYVSEFEDSRNWKLSKTKNSQPRLEVENFLKKFFPNPYNIRSVCTKEKEDLKDVTLRDIVISVLNNQNGVNIAKTNKNLVVADNDIKFCKRETPGKSIKSEHSLEKCNESQSYSNNITNNSSNTEESKGSESSIPHLKNDYPKPFKSYKTRRLLSSNSTSITSSCGSSLESMNEIIQKESALSMKQRKILTARTEREHLGRPSKVKLLLSEDCSDYDIGKLKMLNMTDSEKSLVLKSPLENLKNKYRDDTVSEDFSETTREVYKSNDLNDVQEIYDVINKATESFLSMSAKANSRRISTNTNTRKFMDYLNEGNTKDAELQNHEKKEIESKKSYVSLNKDTLEKGRINKETGNGGSSTEPAVECTTEENLEPETKSVNLLNILLKDNKYEFQSNFEDLQVNEQADDDFDLHQVDNEQSRQIDEVLKFMYVCLKNISSREKQNTENNFPSEDTRTKKTTLLKRFRKENITDTKPLVSQIPKTVNRSCTNQSESLSGKNNFRIRQSQTESRKYPTRIRCRRKPEIFSSFQFAHRKTVAHETPVGAISVIRNFDVQPIPYLESHEPVVSNVLTVESQNELGGYTEKTLEPDENLQIKQSVFPLSAKGKKDKTDSRKTLKDALDNEEKLLSKVAPEKDDKKNVIAVQSKEALIANESANEIGVMPRSSSNFIICLKSYNRNFRLKPSIPFPLAISLSDVEQPWSLRPLSYYPRYVLDKLSLPRIPTSEAFTISCNIKQEILVTGNQSIVEYIATPVCLKVVIEHPKQEQELFLENTKCYISIQVKPPQHEESYYSEPSTSQPKQSSCSEDEEEEKNKRPVKALIEAIKEAEEKVSLLEQGDDSSEDIFTNSQLLSSLSDLKNEALDAEKDSEKKKIHELLLRTCNVQQKLQHFLHKITTAQPSCPSAKTDFDKKLVHWHLQPYESKSESKIDESPFTVQMVDSGTSYDPPLYESSSKKFNESKHEGKCDNESFEQDEHDDDDDDNSSTNSFKSSNDFSETSEGQNGKKESMDFLSTKILKKILHDIKLFKQSFEEEKLASQNKQKDSSSPKNPETSTENRLVQYDQKIPAKVLKTVFKGTKSSTELTIGLKDVPMKKVSNIAVEKTKLAPNHTKISICISKDNSDDLLHLSNQVPHRKLSSYLFDRVRPSLSTCLTEYSHNDDASKSSESLNKDSDDDEDDYKSVGSTLGNSDSDEEESTKCKEEKTVKESPPKNFTKHKFDFYRKVNLDVDSNRIRQSSLQNSMCKYHELEPIKQALTEMQIRMRSIKRDAMFSSNDYYERALKLAKMSAGYCQSCGNRAVIPNDTFGYYKTLLPRRYTQNHRSRPFKTTLTPNPSFYSFHSTPPELSNHICDLDIKRSSSYVLNKPSHSNRTILRSSLHDMPVLLERM